MNSQTSLDLLISTKLFDIPTVSNCGQLILPLSMAKIHGSQNPENIYEFLIKFGEKIKDAQVDVYFIYTNGLYFNTKENSLDLRKKSSKKISHHAQTLKNIIAKTRGFIPKAFHYIAWDSLILNAPLYNDFLTTINKAYFRGKDLYSAINRDITNMGRTINEENISFILEELTITHMIRQKLISLPTCLSNDSDSWRLITYPGMALISDIVLYQKNILPKNNDKRFQNKYQNALYDWKNKHFFNFDRINSFSENLNLQEKQVS